MDSVKRHLFEHQSNPTTGMLTDYLYLCNFSQEKAMLLAILERANGNWIHLSANRFESIVVFSDTSLSAVIDALTDLIAENYVEQHSDGSTITYRLNVPVVQEALNSTLAQYEAWAVKFEEAIRNHPQ